MKERIYRIFGDVMDVPVTTLNDDTSPETVEAWDSLSHMNLVLALEEEFEVQFPDETIVELLSLKKIEEATAKLAG